MTRLRSSQQWKLVREQVLARSSTCHLCRGPLQPDAPPGSPWSSSVDHVVSVKRLMQIDPAGWWDRALDPHNLAACHLVCNQRKGARPRTRTTPPVPRGQSRQWFSTPLGQSRKW